MVRPTIGLISVCLFQFLCDASGGSASSYSERGFGTPDRICEVIVGDKLLRRLRQGVSDAGKGVGGPTSRIRGGRERRIRGCRWALTSGNLVQGRLVGWFWAYGKGSMFPFLPRTRLVYLYNAFQRNSFSSSRKETMHLARMGGKLGPAWEGNNS